MQYAGSFFLIAHFNRQVLMQSLLNVENVAEWIYCIESLFEFDFPSHHTISCCQGIKNVYIFF